MAHGYKKTDGFLRHKYHITKTNGNPIDPNALYFVLRYDIDPHAREAVLAYAKSVADENPILAHDLLEELERTAELAGESDD